MAEAASDTLGLGPQVPEGLIRNLRTALLNPPKSPFSPAYYDRLFSGSFIVPSEPVAILPGISIVV